MKDVFGREWVLVRLPDKKWSDMSDWQKLRDCVLGVVLIILLIYTMGLLSGI